MKNVVITGGCGLIGSSFVKLLSKKNLNIFIADLNQKKAKELIKSIGSKNVFYFNFDVTKDKSIDQTFKKIIAKYKSIDALIHCAYPKSKQLGTPFGRLERKYLNLEFDYHLSSTIILSQKIIKIFSKQKKGNLIFLSSIQGISPPKFEHYFGTNMTSPIEYSALKSGIISITKYLAKLHKKNNIRINCISPGGIIDNQPKKFLKNYLKSTGSKGMLDPEDLVGGIEFLISDKSRYITGQNIVIDDGWTL